MHKVTPVQNEFWALLERFFLTIVERICILIHRVWKNSERKMNKLLGWFITINLVNIFWVFFRADTVDLAFIVLGKLAEGSTEGSGFPLFALAAIGMGFCLQLWGKNMLALCSRWQTMLPWQAQGAAVGLAGSIIMAMGPDGVLPFIYFRF